ncbi:urease accessory protein UreD [Baekduia sp. Peel2402]|uniref:urease accessory protein UreD n=1 Tax=Baekduia sp. Peel2402 TaxID=3458296 RepID=UPI00403E5192
MGMGTGTTTRIEIGCDAGPDGRTRVVRLSASGLLRARVLPAGAGGVARVALVQTAASLLSGDRVALAVTAGAGCRLELVEVAGMIAHDVRGGDGAALDVSVTLAEGARVAWLGQPLTLCAGCDLQRTTRAALADDAALLWRDTLVLGRVGETAGRLASSTDIQHNGVELHVEQLDTGDLALLSSCVVAGAGVRALDTLALYGQRADDDQALQLARAGTLLALPAASLTTTAARLDPLQRRWSEILFPTHAHDELPLAV